MRRGRKVTELLASWPSYRRMIGRCRTWKENPSATPSAVPTLPPRLAARRLCRPAGHCYGECSRQQRLAFPTTSPCFLRSYGLPPGQPSRSPCFREMHGGRGLEAQVQPPDEAFKSRTKTSGVPLPWSGIFAGERIAARVFGSSRGKLPARVFGSSRGKLPAGDFDPSRGKPPVLGGSAVVAIAGNPDASV